MRSGELKWKNRGPDQKVFHTHVRTHCWNSVEKVGCHIEYVQEIWIWESEKSHYHTLITPPGNSMQYSWFQFELWQLQSQPCSLAYQLRANDNLLRNVIMLLGRYTNHQESMHLISFSCRNARPGSFLKQGYGRVSSRACVKESSEMTLVAAWYLYFMLACSNKPAVSQCAKVWADCSELYLYAFVSNVSKTRCFGSK